MTICDDVDWPAEKWATYKKAECEERQRNGCLSGDDDEPCWTCEISRTRRALYEQTKVIGHLVGGDCQKCEWWSRDHKNPNCHCNFKEKEGEK